MTMGTLRLYKGHNAKIVLLCFALLLASCNTLKRVGENDQLLSKNKIFTNGERVLDEDIQSLLVQKPNSMVLGYPLRLNLYNLAKPNPDSTFQEWLYRKPKREARLAKLLSQKQVNRLGESFLVKGYSEWLKKIGEVPVIIDTSRTRRSLERLSAYYGSKGYFNNTTTYSIIPMRKQRAEINYNINLGKPFLIDSFKKNISSPAIDSLYNYATQNSFIRTGEVFDLANFNLERERLTSLFRDSGVYNFQESSISYNIERDTTRANDDQLMNVELTIDDLRRRGDTSVTTSAYKIFRFDKINLFADYQFGINPDSLKSVDYENYTIYYKDKLRYKPKTLTDAVFFEKDSVYRDLDRIRTYRQITNLNTFKYPNIEFIEDPENDVLISNIYLAARPKYSLGLDFDITHSNIQRLGIGFSTALVSRNIFGGAETLSLSARGTFGLLSDESLPEDYFSEVGGEINITFPRIWFPFWLPFLKADRIIPNYMLPTSRISSGISFQQNIGLDKQTFNSIFGYNWSPSDFKRSNLEIVNVQFVRNVNPDRFFNVYTSTYQSLDNIAEQYEDPAEYPELEPLFIETDNPANPLRLRIPEGTTGFTDAILNGDVPASQSNFVDVSRIEERRQRLTENNLIFASNYSFTRNNRSGISDNSFSQIRVKLEAAGNLLSGLANWINFEENDAGNLLVFGVPFSQYVKTEFDYIKHWDLSRSNVLAMRSFFGIAVPFGNSESVPFVRSYFAGGSNDNRAWFPYSLGPGSSQGINDFNEANLKLAFNLEYRFPVVGDIKGALFVDAGNIWNVWDNVDDPSKTFSGFDSLADIAVGSGFGLRYDFSYFVFRLDTGFKTYNPAEEPSKRWFRDYNFANAVFQIGINYPF
ncbi:MAG: BamA/TamA family outer membrane protein [Eudoraea sp.]|nr:outer membrane protein assembly factor [Eudoraea sp.]NNJ40686.1 BamA/TamA family outer membrane protein [Eudoraea sp.]